MLLLQQFDLLLYFSAEGVKAQQRIQKLTPSHDQQSLKHLIPSKELQSIPPLQQRNLFEL